MAREELHTLRYYAWRVGKDGVAKRGDVIAMPTESINLLKRLSGRTIDPPSVIIDPPLVHHGGYSVPCTCVLLWLREIADKYPEAPQDIEGGW